MKKKIACLLLAVVMLVGTVAVFTSCGGGECTHVDKNNDNVCDDCQEEVKGIHQHVDENKDNKCDDCKATIKNNNGGGDGGDEVIEYPWADEDPIELLFQMTNVGGSTNPSGCKQYLAGEDNSKVSALDTNIRERNSDAEEITNVHVTYQYWPNEKDYQWGASVDNILSNTESTSKDVPDIYCNTLYDMMAASLKSAFANLRNTSSKVATDGNYFEFLEEDYDETVDNRGYMYDYMQYATLNMDKMYILASDYFIDLVRSFFAVPVNVNLISSVKDSAGNALTLDSFYDQVRAKKWTYDLAATYSEQVYQEQDGIAGETIGDILGFAFAQGGETASGFVYSTNITVIEREETSDHIGFTYNYPEQSEALVELFDNAKTFVQKTGVVALPRESTPAGDAQNMSKYGGGVEIAIRTRFCDNKILFGGLILVGSLEDDSYQDLNDDKDGGFGVVPMPLYHAVTAENPDESYLTCIHNTTRPGAIARNTDNFSACTAFLNYQSTHSTQILKDYYEIYLQYGLTNGNRGTIEMLQYIRNNVRRSFDKMFEDAIGAYNPDEGGSASLPWHNIMWGASKWGGTAYEIDIRPIYTELRDKKQGLLEELIALYPELP